MMKREIYAEELWPIFLLREMDDFSPSSKVIEVPEKMVERYEKAMREFWEVQRILERLNHERRLQLAKAREIQD